jgi:hypothetical protein
VRRLTIRLKGCPRCGGDLFPEYDLTGSDLVCLQCGYVQPVFIIDRTGDERRDLPVVAGAIDGPGEKAA